MAYLYSRTITFEHSKVGATLTDFPAFINGTYSYLKTVGNGGKVQNSSGYDIAFFSDSALTTQLKHEVQKYVASTGEIEFWIKIPSLSSSSNTVIYMAYGDSTISTSQADTNNTWDSNYKAVWHLGETITGNGQTLSDSTSNGLHLTTASASTYSGTSITGKVGNGIQLLNATSDRLSFTQTTFSGQWSIEGWCNPSVVTNASSWLSNGNGSWNTNWFSAGFRLFTGSSDAIIVSGGSEVAANEWHHWAITRNGTAMVVYKDGVSNNTSSNGANITLQYLGVNADGSFTSNIKFDETRISNVARSAGYYTTIYNNQNSTSTFFYVGNEETMIRSKITGISSITGISTITF